jgi:hypothetical protein
MYELIAGERRLRASKIAGLKQIPALIRIGDDNNTRAELALIENLQREDLNPVDRAMALDRLQKEFAMKTTSSRGGGGTKRCTRPIEPCSWASGVKRGTTGVFTAPRTSRWCRWHTGLGPSRAAAETANGPTFGRGGARDPPYRFEPLAR